MTVPGAPRPSELECEATILQAARAAGWRCHSERPAMNARGNWSTPIKGDAGFPDLVLIHPRRRLMIVAELKRWPNDIEHEQTVWRDMFLAAGITVHLWWVPEQLEAILAFLTGRGPAPFPYDPTKDPTLRRLPLARTKKPTDNARADLDHLTFVGCSVCLLPLSSHTTTELSACKQIAAR